MEKSFTLKKVTQILRVSERTVMRYFKSGKLKASKLGQWRIREKNLEEFLNKNSNKRYAKI